MNEKLEKIKAHVVKHKTVYISVAASIATAGFTYAITRGRHAGVQGAPDGLDAITVRLLDEKPTYWAHQSLKSPPTGHSDFNLSNSSINDSFNKIVNVLEREGRGHPGYMIRHIETGLTYASQKAAAIALGVHPNHLSDHLNGRLDHIDNQHFERIIMAQDVTSPEVA